MSLMPTVVSIIALVACLVLVMSNSQLQEMKKGELLRLALIWGVIILALLLIVQFFGV